MIGEAAAAGFQRCRSGERNDMIGGNMGSPFPGMDPYLEHPALWPDVHHDLASEIRVQLSSQLRPKYVARLTTRQEIDEPDEEELRVIVPDLVVTQKATIELLPMPAVAVATTPTTAVVTNVRRLPFKQASIEIRDVQSGLIVTVIEILSPANKRPDSEGRESYLRKRNALLASTVHLLEIDLLRRGERLPLQPDPPPGDYYVVLSRADRRPDAEVWAIRLQDPLPVVPMPLLAPDPDVSIDLGAALAAVYQRAAYDLDVNYRAAPFPPLEGDDALWAARLLEQ
jgi:hypothetical protein